MMKNLLNTLFIFKGTLTRAQYAVAQTILFFITLGFSLIIIYFQHPTIAIISQLFTFSPNMSLSIINGVYLFSQFALITKRLQDMNWNILLSLLLFAPYVSILLQITCLFWPSKNDRKNHYSARSV